MTDAVNETAWKTGWNTYPVIVLSTVLAGGLGAQADLPSLLVVGFVGGVAVSWWGIAEINRNYDSLIEGFLSDTRRRVSERADVSSDDVLVFSYTQGSGPLGVDAPRRVYASVIVPGDEAIHVTKGVEYDVESRSVAKGGVEKEYYYDRIASVGSRKVGAQRALELTVTDGDDIRIQSGQTDVEDEVATIKRRMRERAAGTA